MTLRQAGSVSPRRHKTGTGRRNTSRRKLYEKENGSAARGCTQTSKCCLDEVSQLLYQPTGSESEEYHKWYYNTLAWQRTTWMGVECYKSPSDMWNYQEILFELKPSLVIEFGSFRGGSALFFASVMRQIGQPFRLLSVDIDHERLAPEARRDEGILFVESSSTVRAITEHFAADKRGPRLDLRNRGIITHLRRANRLRRGFYPREPLARRILGRMLAP